MAKTTSNILWLSVSRAVGLAVLFLAYTQLFRYLGPFSTGQYQFVLSLVALFGVVVDLGVSQYITKKIAEDTSKARYYFRTFLATEVILALGVYGILLLYVFLRGYESVIFQATLVAGLGLFFYGLTIPFLTVMSAFQDLRRVAVINFLAPILNTLLIFSAIHFGFGIVYLSAHQLIFGIVALVLYYNFVKLYIHDPSVLTIFQDIDTALLKKIIKASLPFALLVSFATVYNRIDVVLITHFLGFEKTGLYTAAYKVVDLANFFPAAVSHSLYPVLAGLMARNTISAVKVTLEKYLRFMVAVALPVGMLGSLLAPKLVLILTGNDARFLPSATPLAILVWAIAILFIYVVANSLVVSQLTKFAVYVTSANVLVNVVGNVILLPVLGIKASAIMTVVSESIQGIFYFYFIKKKIVDIEVFKILWRPIVAVLVMGLAVFPLRKLELLEESSVSGLLAILPIIFNVAVVSLLGGMVYVGTLFISRYFTKEDFRFLLSKK